ncbi:MAG: class I SAM-dependent methyltransferase [Pseudomonadota bacterium]
MIPNLPANFDRIKGFLHDREASALYNCALQASRLGPVLEVGSYCGKSTICIGLAVQKHDSIVYALDHHRGSEEHQKGELFHDPDLYNADEDRFDSLAEFRRNILNAGLDAHVVPIVASSQAVAQYWRTPLGMLFIDGGHSLDAALTDYRCWVQHVVRGGLVAIHDIFPDASKGGQAPYAIYQLALASGLFEAVERIETLGIIRRL